MVVLNILGIVLIMFFLLFNLEKQKNILSPFFLFTSLWLCSVIFYAFFVDFANPSILVSALMMISFGYGYICFKNSKKKGEKAKLTGLILGGKEFVLFSGCLGIFLNLFLLYDANGLNYNLLSTILKSASYYSSLRYQNEIGIPVAARVGNVIIFVGTALGFLFYFEKRCLNEKNNLFFLMPAATILFECIILGQKSIAVLCFIYGLSSYIIIINYHNVKVKLKKIFINVTVLLFLLFCLVIFAHYLRAGGELKVVDILLKILTSYFFLPFFAFLEWNKDNTFLIMPPTEWGMNLFAGISSLFFEEYGKRGEFINLIINEKEYITNVYTTLRPSIEDFGVLGSLLFFYTIGIIVGYSISNISKGKIIFIPIYYAFSNFIFFSFAGSIFKYISNILVIICLLILFFVSRLIQIEKNRKNC